MNGAFSVEVFRDYESKDIDTSIVEQGLELMRLQSVGLKIVRNTRLLRLKLDDSAAIPIDQLRLPSLESDINIILTNRPLARAAQEPTSRILGFASRADGSAVIRQQEHAHTTVAHEVGHLMGLKKSGERYDGDSHCLNKECLMHEHAEVVSETVRVKKHGIKGWMERRGYVPADYVETKKPRTESFCDECSHQLGYNAFWLLKLKHGETVPQDIKGIMRDRTA